MTSQRRTYVRDDAYTGRSSSNQKKKNNNKKPRASGSREHYFHFLIGYLLPLVHAQQRRPLQEEYAVLECGPLMTPLLEETLSRLNHQRFTLVSPASVTNPIYVEAWDEHWDDGAAVKEAAAAVADVWLGTPCSQPDCPSPDSGDALLIERSPAPDFYVKGAAERPGYGLSRRGIVNWPEVQEHLKAKGIDHALYEPGRHGLGCQIARFQRARRIVGIRGAEWANVIWSKPGSRIRLLDPDPPARLISGLVERTGIVCQMVPVESTAPREDPVAVARFLTASD